MLTIPHQPKDYQEPWYIQGEVYFFMDTVTLSPLQKLSIAILSEASVSLGDLFRLS